MMVPRKPTPRRTSAASTGSERVPDARLTHLLDQQAAALLEGRIATRWATPGDWVTGNGLLAPTLFRSYPAMLADLDHTAVCVHHRKTGTAATRYYWPAVGEQILCSDVCMYGPDGLWLGLQRAVAAGMVSLDCEACGRPIDDRFLCLVAPVGGSLTFHLIACRECVTSAAPLEVLPA